MSKLISVAGYSFKDGAFKFRCANDIKRAAQLEALGDTLVNMIELPQPMTKSDAAKHMLTINYAKGKAEIEAVFTAAVADENPFAKKPAKVAKPKKPATVKVTKKPVVAPAEVLNFSPSQAAKIRAEFMKKLKLVYEAN